MSQKCIMNCKEFTQLFDFPADDEERENWCKVLRLEQINTNDRLCDLHFDPEYIDERHLKVDALPEKPKPPREKSSTPRSFGGIIEVPPERDNTGFETIYLTLETQSPAKRPAPTVIKSYEKKTYTKRKANKEFDEKNSTKITSDLEAANRATAKMTQRIAANNPGFEPVTCTFESPPKRTYAQGGKPKTPQLDITMTCYCRCHKRDEAAQREMLKTIETMKKTEEEQSQTIQNLMSQNNISEHLLKTKSKRISDLVIVEQHLRNEIEKLQTRIEVMNKRQIKAAADASENGIMFARMICGKRKMYTKNEIALAQKVFSVSGRCYNFMRDVLMLNLPHKSTLKRQRQLKASDYAEQHHPFDEGPEIGSEIEMKLEDVYNNEHFEVLEPTEGSSNVAI